MAFATLAELAVRLGRVDITELTDAQVLLGEQLLSTASSVITDAVGKTAAWQDALTPVPPILRAVCLEMAARVMQNPVGARSENETLGQYQHAIGFVDGAHGLLLTDREERLCRKAVFGRSNATTHPDTTVGTLIELRDTGDIAGLPAG